MIKYNDRNSIIFDLVQLIGETNEMLLIEKYYAPDDWYIQVGLEQTSYKDLETLISGKGRQGELERAIWYINNKII